MAGFYWHLDRAAHPLLKAVSRALSLTEVDNRHIFDLHSGHDNQLRLPQYPLIPTEQLHIWALARMPTHHKLPARKVKSLPAIHFFSAPPILNLVHSQCSFWTITEA